jgi:hypothetical protein
MLDTSQAACLRGDRVGTQFRKLVLLCQPTSWSIKKNVASIRREKQDFSENIDVARRQRLVVAHIGAEEECENEIGFGAGRDAVKKLYLALSLKWLRRVRAHHCVELLYVRTSMSRVALASNCFRREFSCSGVFKRLTSAGSVCA